MNIWHDISPKRITPDDFYAVIEISKGDKNKYELDKETSVAEVSGMKKAKETIKKCIECYITDFQMA